MTRTTRTKKPLRRVSQKRAALKRRSDPARRAFVQAAECCMICRRVNHLECHEIARGIGRERSLERPELWLAVCRECHEELGDAKRWPPARQLAERTLWGLQWACAMLNEARGRAADATGIGDVLKYLGRFYP
ncbi:MAG: hypothetical protein L0Z50_12880 [Verrucomicrobiales bacterium]|nr:hypothetical protein [Verrucomicrobiales bacterium]